MVTGTVIRPVRGAGLVSALLPLHMPFKDAPALIRANPRSLGVPARFAPQFATDTRAITTASFRRMLRANQRFRIPAGLAAAGVPLLLLAGEREARAVKASLRDLAAAVPGADCRLVAGTSHAWPLTDPDLFAAALRAFAQGGALPARLHAARQGTR